MASICEKKKTGDTILTSFSVSMGHNCSDKSPIELQKHETHSVTVEEALENMSLLQRECKALVSRVNQWSRNQIGGCLKHNNVITWRKGDLKERECVDCGQQQSFVMTYDFVGHGPDRSFWMKGQFHSTGSSS